MQKSVLIVDDDADVRRGLCLLVEKKALLWEAAASGEAAMQTLQHRHFDIVFTDLKMQGMNGMDLLREIKRRWPKTAVIVITGFGTIETAVQAMSQGAKHYITKPFNNKEIFLTVDRVLREQEIVDELIHLRAEVERKYGFHSLVGRDRQMTEVFELIRKVSQTTVPVLIRGESGTGKELAARAIHYEGPRKKWKFVALNASALPDTLLEGELFGSRKGAYTGADQNRLGLLARSSGGTFLLDEIGDMSPLIQSKLLRVLQEKEVTPLGSSDPVKLDLRVIASTNVDLEKAVREKCFREDLYYRLNVVQISLPPLREREGDIPLLAEHFIRRFSDEQGCEPKVLAPSAMRILTTYHWPGNVRELENVAHRAMVIAEGSQITHRDLILSDDRFKAIHPRDGYHGLPYDQAKERAIETFQRDYITRALAESGGNITHAAEKSGITRAALRRIIQRHQISPRPPKAGNLSADSV